MAVDHHGRCRDRLRAHAGHDRRGEPRAGWQLRRGDRRHVTQTVRYFAASLALAILGSVLIHQTRANATASLAKLHIPSNAAAKIVASINTGAGRPAPHGRGTSAVYAAIQGDFADATRIVYLAMAGIMAASFVVAVRRMERGIPAEVTEAVEAEAAPDAG